MWDGIPVMFYKNGRAVMAIIVVVVRFVAVYEVDGLEVGFGLRWGQGVGNKVELV